MCHCAGHTVCEYHENRIRDLYAALAAAERDGRGVQRLLRGELASYGVRADIVKLRLGIEAYERQEANR